jgi:hypothetical protein
VAYCGSTNYGDYDYGAFWFNLEPVATTAATEADVLFIGNSRTQFGLSSEFTNNWFATAKATHYLLGFAYDGNYWFTEPLLHRLQPKARAYVVNLDLFFEPEPTEPARVVMHDASASARYRRKKLWQATQLFVCSTFRALCGQEAAFFRSRVTGSWQIEGGQFVGAPVSYDRNIDPDVRQRYITTGRRFLDALPVPAECQILTVVPAVGTPIGTAEAIASALGRTLIVPEVDALHLFDGSHLDPPSSERWSQAFLTEVTPHIARCLEKPISGAINANVTANEQL